MRASLTSLLAVLRHVAARVSLQTAASYPSIALSLFITLQLQSCSVMCCHAHCGAPPSSAPVQDSTLRVWDCATGRQLAFFMADAALVTVTFAGHPYPDILVAGDAGGAVHFLDLPVELLPGTVRY